MGFAGSSFAKSDIHAADRHSGLGDAARGKGGTSSIGGNPANMATGNLARTSGKNLYAYNNNSVTNVVAFQRTIPFDDSASVVDNDLASYTGTGGICKACSKCAGYCRRACKCGASLRTPAAGSNGTSGLARATNVGTAALAGTITGASTRVDRSADINQVDRNASTDGTTSGEHDFTDAFHHASANNGTLRTTSIIRANEVDSAAINGITSNFAYAVTNSWTGYARATK